MAAAHQLRSRSHPAEDELTGHDDSPAVTYKGNSRFFTTRTPPRHAQATDNDPTGGLLRPAPDVHGLQVQPAPGRHRPRAISEHLQDPAPANPAIHPSCAGSAHTTGTATAAEQFGVLVWAGATTWSGSTWPGSSTANQSFTIDPSAPRHPRSPRAPSSRAADR